MSAITVKIKEGSYDNEDAVGNVICYIMRLHNPFLVNGYGVFPIKENYVIGQFNYIKNLYGKNQGKRVFHIIISVDPTLRLDESYMMKLAHLIGGYFGNERQVLYAVHNDSDNLHIHMCVNTVAFTNGKYIEFVDINELKKYAKKCLDMLVDEYWFNKRTLINGVVYEM